MDFLAIDRDRFDVVAIAGNSMGWYTALGLGGALADGGDYTLLQTMGAMMKDGLVGGQLIYPLVNEEWRRDSEKEKMVAEALESPGDPSTIQSITAAMVSSAGRRRRWMNWGKRSRPLMITLPDSVQRRLPHPAHGGHLRPRL